MRLLVLGGVGMLGRAVVAHARTLGWAALGLSEEQADITDPERLRWWISSFRPGTVINCAALTQVDACEEQVERAMEVNGRAVALVASAAERSGARLVQVSTDYVFDGEAMEPYREDDVTGPRSAYGRSKLAGEEAALSVGGLVVRSSWLFGPGGANFVTTMIGLMNAGRVPLRVVDDQVGRPTFTPFLAQALCELAAREISGIVHYGNREAVSWYDFGREIAALWDGRVQVEPVPTEEFPRPAPRPAYSVLDVTRYESIVGRRVEAWGWGLARYVDWIRKGVPV